MFITISLLLAAACLLPAVGKLRQVGPAKGHKPRSCRNRLIRPDRRSQHLRRVLRRYRAFRP